MDIDKRLEELNGSPQEALARLRRMNAEAAFASEHMEEWRATYPDHWVFVYDGVLVAAESDFEKFRDAIAGSGVPAGRGLVQFVPKEKYFLIL